MESKTYALLRIVCGLLFSVHGIQKIFGSNPLGTQTWLGAVIELAGGILIAAGLFTRVAAFIASGTMAVADFQFHWKLVFADWEWVPQINKGELAVVYCFLFLYVAARGAGAFSLDARLRKTTSDAPTMAADAPKSVA